MARWARQPLNVRWADDATFDGQLHFVRIFEGSKGCETELRFCAVTSLGFQMFAINQIPNDGDHAEQFWHWHDIIDARVDKTDRMRFHIMIGSHNNYGRETTLEFMDKGRDSSSVEGRVRQWVQSIRVELDRAWAGTHTSTHGGAISGARGRKSKSKSARALGYATKLALKTHKVPLFGAVLGRNIAESMWTSLTSTVDEAMDFLAGKEDIESDEFEDAASESDAEGSTGSDMSDGPPRQREIRSREQLANLEWTSEELASRDKYLKEDDQLLLDQLACQSPAPARPNNHSPRKPGVTPIAETWNRLRSPPPRSDSDQPLELEQGQGRKGRRAGSEVGRGQAEGWHEHEARAGARSAIDGGGGDDWQSMSEEEWREHERHRTTHTFKASSRASSSGLGGAPHDMRVDSDAQALTLLDESADASTLTVRHVCAVEERLVAAEALLRRVRGIIRVHACTDGSSVHVYSYGGSVRPRVCACTHEGIGEPLNAVPMRPIPACASSYRRDRYEEMGCGRLNEALRWQAKELDREHDQILARVKSQVGVTESFESSLATTLRHNSADAPSHKTLLTLGLHAPFCSVYVRACMCVCVRACRRLPVRSGRCIRESIWNDGTRTHTRAHAHTHTHTGHRCQELGQQLSGVTAVLGKTQEQGAKLQDTYQRLQTRVQNAKNKVDVLTNDVDRIDKEGEANEERLAAARVIFGSNHDFI